MTEFLNSLQYAANPDGQPTVKAFMTTEKSKKQTILYNASLLFWDNFLTRINSDKIVDNLC